MIDPRTASLFLNPSSRSGRGRRGWPVFRGRGFGEVITRSRADAIAAVAGSGDRVAVAVGGDGTINMVVNGIKRSGDGDRAMGVLYAGTSPDFCRFHGIPVAPEEALRVLETGNEVAVDLGRITGAGYEAWFASSCNIGMGPEVAAFANRVRKFLGDTLGTGIALLRAFIRHRRFALELEIDGRVERFERVVHVAVLKNPYIASGIFLDLDLAPDDGQLRVVVFPELRMRDLPGLYRGRLPAEARVFACRKVAIATTPAREIEFDGDAYDYCTPLRLECWQKTLRLIK